MEKEVSKNILQDFRHRYFLLKYYEIVNKKTECLYHLGVDLYNQILKIINESKYFSKMSLSFIIDIYDRKLVYVLDSDIKKSQKYIEDYDLESLFKEYKASYKLIYNQNVIRLSTIENNILSVIAIENIWTFIIYKGKSNKRLIINPNMFATFKTFNSRYYKINKI